MKEKYLTASLEFVAFEKTDVIATSNPTAPPGWDSDGNVDSGGWT